jgi:hypothetical protein
VESGLYRSGYSAPVASSSSFPVLFFPPVPSNRWEGKPLLFISLSLLPIVVLIYSIYNFLAVLLWTALPN